MVAAPEAGPGRLANGNSMHRVRVVVSMGCVNFEGAVKPGPASQRNFDLRWHCRPSSRGPSSQSLHISIGAIESTRWAAEVGGRRPSRAKADAGNSTTHNCWLAYHRSCSPSARCRPSSVCLTAIHRRAFSSVKRMHPGVWLSGICYVDGRATTSMLILWRRCLSHLD